MADSAKTLELQIRVAAQEAVKSVNTLKGEMQALAREAKKFADDNTLEKSFHEAEGAAKDTARGVNEIVRAGMKLAEVAAAAKALSVIKDMGVFALQTADSFQTARNQFGTLLGDMEAGAGLFNQIKAFNDKTPFNLDTLTQATNVLIAAKVPLSELQTELTKFGDLSQGNSQKFTSYVNAFSKAAAKGKADMEVLNAYLNQGVPILDALAKRFNTTTAEIVEMTSQGKIGFGDFSAALNDLTAQGGAYFGGMELGSQSLAAMQEGLRESVNTLAASFGDMLLPSAIAVVKALTDITNAINNSPILKGVLIGALVGITGVLGAMAIKAMIAFAAQMSLNLAFGALNPVVLASTIAVAGLAAGYVTYASLQQKAAREAENMAYQQRIQKDALDETAGSLKAYTDALKGMTDADVYKNIDVIKRNITAVKEAIKDIEGYYATALSKGKENLADYWAEVLAAERVNLERAQHSLLAAQEILGDRRTDWIDSMFGGTQAGKIQKLNNQLAIARRYLTGPDLGSGQRSQLEEIIKNINAEIDKLTAKSSQTKTWQTWFSEIAKIDPASFGASGEKAAEAYLSGFSRALGSGQEIAEALGEKFDLAAALKSQQAEIQKTITELFSIDPEKINEPFTIQDKAVRSLIAEYERLGVEIKKQEDNRTITTILEGLDEEVKNLTRDQYDLALATLEAADASGEQISRAEELIAALREDSAKKRLREARDSIVDWQTVLSDTVAQALMNLEGFDDKAAVIIADLSAQLADVSFSAALSGFEEFGRALAETGDAGESLGRALASMAQQILNQLPMMFLQAGLQLIAQGQWPLGLGFIAAAGSTAIIAGYTDGKINQAKKEASEHAQGGIFDEYGRAARAFASGGTFTNQIVREPTYFAHGGGLGLMGEAGPEAVMPLKRMASGDLGVETSGSGGGAVVVVNIINNSGAEVRQEETTDAAGNKQLDVIIGGMVNNHIASGKADRVMSSRYNLRAAGV